MPAPIIPWEPANIPVEIQGELNRRKINRSFKYDGWDTATGDWSKYRGPMTPWVRFCSNGAGSPGKDKVTLDILSQEGVSVQYFDKQGFVLFGGKDFYSGYGFTKPFNGGQSPVNIIGYMPNGTPHTIDNNLKTSDYPIHVPPPEIEKIDVIIQKELYRRAKIEWVCFSKAQLEYMTPYFLVPGITCILEWGWNLFNPNSLVNLEDVPRLKKYNDNPYPLYTNNILSSNGNYDVLFGKITSFEWSVDGNKFKCVTEITSQDRLYAGLVVDSISEFRNKDATEENKKVTPFGDLKNFINKTLPMFKDVRNSIPPLLDDTVSYIKEHHPNNWEEYVYGVFYGRDSEVVKNKVIEQNYIYMGNFGGVTNKSGNEEKNNSSDRDFDRPAGSKDLWLNFGLVIECINKHHDKLETAKRNQIFRVDIDDVVISGHPNLISCDGSVLLIPNAIAPKYFSGQHGFRPPPGKSEPTRKVPSEPGDYDVLRNSTVPVNKSATKRKTAEEADEGGAVGTISDYRLYSVCLQQGGSYRDNIDELINHVRYTDISIRRNYAFPFKSDMIIGKHEYRKKYSGLLRDLYINVEYLKKLIENTSIKTYTQLIEELMNDISKAAGGFWDFRLVSGTGSWENEDEDKPATMKIVDYKFVNLQNIVAPVYTFDYSDADSLLLGLGFKPTISNAHAIRTIYAQTNNPGNKVVLTNGENELLDYIFKDRLALDSQGKEPTGKQEVDNEHWETMRLLQQIDPPNPKVYQMTTKENDKIIIRRLAIPPDQASILKLLLDDGDEKNNPKYTGIMPGIQASFTLQGIGGLRTFMMFLVRNLPKPYSHKNIVFRIVDVQETVEAGKWNTTITAGVIPLRENIAQRLGIDLKSD
jgi:hypothetical protein